MAPLIQASNGDLYGTTLRFRPTITAPSFEFTTGGALTTIYSFCSLSGCADGVEPYGPLFQASNGDLYGTTSFDGPEQRIGHHLQNDAGGQGEDDSGPSYTPGAATCPRPQLIKKRRRSVGMTPTGSGGNGCAFWYNRFQDHLPRAKSPIFTTSPPKRIPEGGNPEGALNQASRNGNFYGTTSVGGANGWGTVFEIKAAGKFAALLHLRKSWLNQRLRSPLHYHPNYTDGNLYGTTEYGGDYYKGQRVAPLLPGLLRLSPVFEITTAGKKKSWANVLRNQWLSGWLLSYVGIDPGYQRDVLWSHGRGRR